MKLPCWICKNSMARLVRPRVFAVTCLLAVAIAGCGNTRKLAPEYRAPATGEVMPQTVPATGGVMNASDAVKGDVVRQIAPVWDGLKQRLAKDGLSGPAVDGLLAQLGPVPTQSPMGRKILELYKKNFFPRPKTGQPAQKYYKGVVTRANADLCRQFINGHKTAFANAQKRYGVPEAIAASLLFVETRLGRVLADVPENAFFTLASMAISTSPQDISQWLPKLKDYERHLGWLEETMRKRADWAYNETRALVAHMLKDAVSPQNLPSSIYGAVGLCQFMPSNISVYGADGDNDGRVDLFNVSDAVASLANYLARHGWKPGISRERQRKVLMSYNHSRVYADTILALADLVARGKA